MNRCSAKFFSLFGVFLITAIGLGAQEDDAPSILDELSPLVRSSVQEDLASATYRDLVFWSQELGLSILGSRNELLARIQDYYGLSDVVPSVQDRDGSPASDETEVIIDAADSVDFFEIEEISEDYVRIGGGVRLSLVENDTTHSISADQLVLNRSQNIITTMGEVSYTTIRDGEVIQEFKGDTLSLNIKSWEGIFLGGLTTMDQTIDGKSVAMFFQGETVFRSGRDLVAFENAKIFTSSVKDPYMSFRAQKLWFLAPKEWAVVNTVVAVGRVPLLYLPFFFQPGDRLFFRPTIGFHSLYGTYIQTTTYIMGKPEESGASFSVLQVSSSGEEPDREIEGLFLRPVQTPKETAANNYSWKVMLDGYTKKGVYLATQADMSGLADIRPFTFRFGLAFSRMLFDLGSTEQNFVIHEQRLTDYWDRSYLLTSELPLRYELQLGLGWRSSGFSVNLTGDLYSDRYMQKDFYTRLESFSWDFALGRRLKPSTSYSDISASLWKFSTSYRPSFNSDAWRKFSRYLNIRLDSLTVDLQIQSKSTDRARLPSIAQRSDIIDNTQSKFFYPYRLTAPNLRLSLSGTLVDYTLGTSRSASLDDATGQAEEDSLLLPPWEADTSEVLPPPSADELLVLPKLRETTYATSDIRPLEFSLSYAINPSMKIDQYTNSQVWDHPSDIENYGFFRFSQLENANRISLRHSLKLFGGVADLSGSTTSQLNFSSLLFYDEDQYTEAELKSLREQTYKKSSQTLEISNTLRIFPFQRFPLLRKSNINYNTGFLLVDRSFSKLDNISPVYELETFEFTEDFVKQHTVGASLIFDVLNKSQELSLVTTLPPKKNTSLIPSLVLRFWLLEASATTKILSPDTIPVYEPIDLRFRFIWKNYINASQLLRIDPEEQGEIISSVSSLTSSLRDRIVEFSFTATMQKRKGLNFDRTTDSWVSDDVEILRLEKITSLLRVNYSIPPLWKNRINLRLTAALQLSFDFLQFTESSLNLEYGFRFSIFQRLVIDFRAVVRNQALHTYVASYTEQLGIDRRDFFADLGKSLNIAATKDLEEGLFKLSSIQLGVTQEFPDWDLKISYEGGPKLAQRRGNKSV